MLFSRPKTKQVYYPRNVGLLTLGNRNTYSYLITGKEGKGAEAQVLSRCLKHKARVLSQSSYVDEIMGEFTMSLICDLSKSDCVPDDFVLYLREIKSVKDVLTAEMNNKFFEGFLFPLTLLDSSRAIALDSDFVFQLQNRLDTQQAKSLLIEWGRSYVQDVIKRISEKLPEKTEDESVAENVVGYLRSAGWGTFRWKTEGEVEHVLVQDPPTSKDGAAHGNLFVMGMAVGIVSTFLKRGMVVATDSYDEETRLLSMVLADERVLETQLTADAKKAERENEKKVLKEVERIAKSVEEEKPEQGRPEEKLQEIEVPVASESEQQILVSSRKPSDLRAFLREDEFSTEDAI